MDAINKIYQSGSNEIKKNIINNKGIEKGLIKSVCLKCGRQYKSETNICQKCFSTTKTL